jgi:DNA-binding transcriptional MerR regulator
MKIGDLARATGTTASTLRYYEQCFLLKAPYRIGGQRRYSVEAVPRVLLIRFASEMGFSLRDIRVFLDGLRENAPVGRRWRNLAQRKIQEVDAIIERSHRLRSLLVHLLDCECTSLRMCVERLRLNPTLPLIAQSSQKGRLAKRRR